MNSHPTMFDRIMLLTAFPPAPPIPTTVMRGLSSCSSFGMLRLIIVSPSTPCAAAEHVRPHVLPWGPASPSFRSPRIGARTARFRLRSPDDRGWILPVLRRTKYPKASKKSDLSKVLAQPLTNPAENPARRWARRQRRLGPLRQGEQQQSGGGRETRAVRRFGEPADPRRTPDPDLLVEDQPGQFAGAVQLAGAAGQHHPAAGDLVEAARFEPVAHHFEGLLDARRDDADQQRFRHVVDVAILFLADLRHRDRLALVEGRGDGAAEQCLQPFGM